MTFSNSKTVTFKVFCTIPVGVHGGQSKVVFVLFGVGGGTDSLLFLKRIVEGKYVEMGKGENVFTLETFNL